MSMHADGAKAALPARVVMLAICRKGIEAFTQRALSYGAIAFQPDRIHSQTRRVWYCHRAVTFLKSKHEPGGFSMPNCIINALWMLLFAIALLSTSAAAQDKKLILTGSSTVAPLASEIAKRFEERNRGTRVDVQSGGSSRGIGDARSGTADIGMVSRAMTAAESDLQSFIIAYDGVCIILHKSNVVNALTDEQITGIYTGKITNWKEVGGADRKITVVNKAEGRSTLEVFLAYFKLNNRDIKAQVVIGDNQQGVKTVAGNPGAIGYVSIGTAEFEAQNGAALKLLALGGVAATTANVQAGKFPLSRPLNLVTKTVPAGLTKTFIDFARSPDVADLVKEQFFVPPVR
jgi:phosphate transport system substrate-binding protein